MQNVPEIWVVYETDADACISHSSLVGHQSLAEALVTASMMSGGGKASFDVEAGAKILGATFKNNNIEVPTIVQVALLPIMQ